MVWGGMADYDLTLTFYPARPNCNGKVLFHKNAWESGSEASFKPTIYNKRAGKNESFSRTKAARPSYKLKVAHQLIQRKQPTSGVSQTSRTLLKKGEWPANSPDLNPIENLRSIIDEAAYRDPFPKAMGGLTSRLRQAWRNIPLASLSELARAKV